MANFRFGTLESHHPIDLGGYGGGFWHRRFPTAAHLACRNTPPGLGSKRSSPDIPFRKGFALGKNRTASRLGCPTAPARGCSVFREIAGSGWGELDRELLVGWGGGACPQKYHRCRPVSGRGCSQESTGGRSKSDTAV